MVNFEIIRFPLIFGSFLLAAGSAYLLRDQFIPNLEEERKRIFRGSDEDRETISQYLKSMKPT